MSRLAGARSSGARAAACAVGALALTSCLAGCRHGITDSATGFPRAETLYVGGRQWGEPSSFNPLASNPDWPVSATTLLYETLLLFNSETGKMEPSLAESFTENDDSIEIVLNPAARWNDGTPVTGDDVKYSFDLGRTYKSLPMSPLWRNLSEITIGDAGAAPYPRHVVFHLTSEQRNPLVVLDALTDTRIVPKHVIEPLLATLHGSIDEFNKLKFDQDPVGSGPYRLHSYSSEKIVTVRDDAYWGNAALFGGKLPAPKYVIHPIYKSNDHFSVSLQQGRLDASASFVPRIWLKQAKGVRSWYDAAPYFEAASIPMLFINVTHGALGDVAYRRAMAFAINYTDIRELAVSGYSEPLKPGLVLPFGLEAKFYSDQDATEYGTTFDPERAKQTLKDAGYRAIWSKTGDLEETLDKTGTRVPTMFIKSPTGWSDWESIVRIAVKSMREAGIDVRERFVDATVYSIALSAGDFDLIMNTPAPAPTPSKPWSRFETIMTTRNFAPEGEKAYTNMGRFNNPKAPGYIARIDELLTQIPTIRDETALISAYRELNVLFMKNQPTLPLVYRPDQFYEFSTKVWTGFPTADNPYLPPQIPGDRLGTRMLWHLLPVAKD